jgi:NADPH:quinone reductase-like Zn-dependent oxidoreductase
VDVVFNHVGQATFDRDLQVLARGGRLLVCGATSGRQVQFDLRVLFGKNLKVFGSRLGRRDSLKEILQGFAQGLYTPVLDRVYPLVETADAHRHMENRQNFGKIIIKVPSSSESCC